MAFMSLLPLRIHSIKRVMRNEKAIGDIRKRHRRSVPTAAAQSKFISNIVHIAPEKLSLVYTLFSLVRMVWCGEV